MVNLYINNQSQFSYFYEGPFIQRIFITCFKLPLCFLSFSGYKTYKTCSMGITKLDFILKRWHKILLPTATKLDRSWRSSWVWKKKEFPNKSTFLPLCNMYESPSARHQTSHHLPASWCHEKWSDPSSNDVIFLYYHLPFNFMEVSFCKKIEILL